MDPVDSAEQQIADKDFAELDKIVSGLIDVIIKCKYPKPTKYKLIFKYFLRRKHNMAYTLTKADIY